MSVTVAALMGVVLAVAIALALTPGTAGSAPRLALPVAAEKARDYVKRTCSRDIHCVRSGVLNCHRKRPRVAFCRVFIRRDTRFQGRYQCSRLIRLAPSSARTARVTGLGAWSCPDS
jgi:hypothetical protein